MAKFDEELDAIATSIEKLEKKIRRGLAAIEAKRASERQGQ